MTTRIRVSGTLFHTPESRTLKAGRTSATATTATLKAKDGNYTQFWRIAAFSEPVQVELMRLTAGDAVAVDRALRLLKKVVSITFAEPVQMRHGNPIRY